MAHHRRSRLQHKVHKHEHVTASKEVQAERVARETDHARKIEQNRLERAREEAPGRSARISNEA